MRLKSLAILVLAAFSLQSCGGEASGPVSVARGKTMIIHVLSNPEGLNPFITTDAATTYIENMIFDNLIVLDPKTLEIKPQLAVALPEISDNYTTLTFKINPKARFSDGKPVTAADVVFSFKAFINPLCETANTRAELHSFSDCIAVDDHTVQFKLAQSGPLNLNRFAIHFHVLPRHIYDPNKLTDKYTCAEAITAELNPSRLGAESMGNLQAFANQFNDEKFMREPGYVVGSGRYTLESWRSNQYLTLVKNPNYWNAGSSDPFAQQNMDTLIYKTINDMETALVSLKNGEIDFSHFFEPAQFKEKMTGDGFEAGFEKKALPYPAYEYIGWNTNIKNHPEKVFFRDKRVRWAMTYLVNVKDVVENVTYGAFHPITSMVHNTRPEFNKEIPVVVADEEKAKALLNEAGWTDSDGDGVLDKIVDGKKVKFSFTMYYRKGMTIRRNIAISLKEVFKKAGIEMEIEELEANYMTSLLENHELDAWIAGWAYDSDEQDYYSLFHSSQIPNGGYNYGSYYNPEADQVMLSILAEWDTNKRYDLHRRIQKILYDDQPYTLLFGHSFLIGYNKRLENGNWYNQRPCYDPAQFRASGVKAN